MFASMIQQSFRWYQRIWRTLTKQFSYWRFFKKKRAHFQNLTTRQRLVLIKTVKIFLCVEWLAGWLVVWLHGPLVLWPTTFYIYSIYTV